MKKIPTVFLRDENDRKHVTREVNPVCQWVFDGEGAATRKYDGTCCLIRDGKFYKRYEVKAGKKTPADFEPANEVDPNTGKQAGWVPVGDGPTDRYHREAWVDGLADGTYELVGPKVQGNPEEYERHVLVSHADAQPLPNVPRDFEGLRKWLGLTAYEGIVWHHPDGRMAKLKVRDVL